jgi:hypothetical protein
VYQPAGTAGVAGCAGAVGVEAGVDDEAPEPHPLEPLEVLEPALDAHPLSPVLLWPHEEAPVLDGSGAVPHPDGSLTGPPASVVAGSAAAEDARVAAVDVEEVDEPEDAEPAVAEDDERFTYAVMSLPAGTMATTSQPSADLSESFAASEAAS